MSMILRRPGRGLLAHTIILAGPLLLFAPSAFGGPDHWAGIETANAAGLVVGAPQTVAVTYWRALTPGTEICLHAGSAVFFSSAGARVQVRSPRSGWHPYAFAGYAAMYSTGGEYGDPAGLSGYFWLGPGVSFQTRRLTLFAEICALLDGDESRGLGVKTWIFPFDPAVSGGLMIRF